MEPRVVGRLVAAAALALGDLAAAFGRDGDPRPTASRFDFVPSSRKVTKCPTPLDLLWK